MRRRADVLGQLPLVIGVTGHRDIRRGDAARLKRAVDAIFRNLEKTYPHTPLIVLSPLTEGAERLVARVALRRGAKLVVPLPMPVDSFATDFANERSLREFRWLCERADAVYVVPFVDPGDGPDVPLPGVRYAASGAYIALNSDVLIALWDGEKSDALGSTACIVDYRLRGIPELFAAPSSALDAVDSGVVLHIVTPRHDGVTPANSFMIQFLVPPGWDDSGEPRAYYRTIFRRIEVFNADSRKLSAAMKWQDAAHLRATKLFVIAEELAIRYQSRSFRAIYAIFWIVALAGIAFELFAHLLHNTSSLAFAIFALMAATLIFTFTQRSGYEVKAQDYRALAEGLRIEHYWHAADITDCAADYYLRRQKSDVDWIRSAIRSWHVLADARASKDTLREPLRARLHMVYEDWIVNQLAWFTKSRVVQYRKALGFNRFASATLLAGFLLATVALGWLVSNHASIEDQRWGELLVTVVALTIVVSDRLRSYSEKREWLSHSKQHGRMSLIFTQAATTMKRLLTEPSPANLFSAQNLLRDLGRETLMENGDWLLLHREGPLDMPEG